MFSRLAFGKAWEGLVLVYYTLVEFTNEAIWSSAFFPCEIID